jgi:L-Ala-D/L-Glu epimerase / N-acetyl-D-glutamate racemase
MPVAIDESAALPGALERGGLPEDRPLRGISGLLAAASRARGAGYEIYLASTLNGPLGIAAALHAAALHAAALHAAAAVRPDRPGGLATLSPT